MLKALVIQMAETPRSSRYVAVGSLEIEATAKPKNPWMKMTMENLKPPPTKQVASQMTPFQGTVIPARKATMSILAPNASSQVTAVTMTPAQASNSERGRITATAA